MTPSPIQKEFQDFIQAKKESLTNAQFKDAFTNASRIIRLAITDINARIDARLAQIKDGERGCKFLGVFKNEKDLPSANSYQQGDFAIVGEQGTIWYIV